MNTTLKKSTYILGISVLFTCCNMKQSEKDGSISRSNAIVQLETATATKDSIPPNAKNEAKNPLPIHGTISRENLERYFPKVMDTLQDLRIVGSEKIDLNPGNGIIVSILHNTATFDQMFLCTHDSNLTLVDYLYIGKATTFDKTSHSIHFETTSPNSIRFDQVDWGYVQKGDGFEIDTVKFERYSIVVDNHGEIKK